MDDHASHALDQAVRALAAGSASTPPGLSLKDSVALASQFELSRREIELAALNAGVLPERYRRNYGTVGFQGQMRLLQARVGIAGAGGLGGWIVEALARMGVGKLTVVDGDVFEENNLNRQATCLESTLGRPKAEVAAERAAEVNGAVEVTAHRKWLTADNATTLLGGCQIVVDALDSLPTRMMLAAAAREMGIPLVHGAIAGYTGQVTIVYPGDAGLAAIYGPGPYPERGVEVSQGNPSATPMMIAAWQVQQVVKYLIGAERGLLRGRLLILDAGAGDALTLDLPTPDEQNASREG